MMVGKRRSYDLILGSFVALGLLLLIVLIFLIGRERRLFDTSVSVETHFPNVAGLALGADVMLAGVVVGHVSEIKFPKLKLDTPGMSRDVRVIMEISSGAMRWVREDSLARIDSKGLLGDKLINIAIGSPELPQLQEGGLLKSTPPVDFNKALQQAQQILENVTETVSDAKDIFKGFVKEGGDKALAESAKYLRGILKEVEDGDGIAHQLIYDKKAGLDTKKALASLKKTLSDIQSVIGEAKSGENLMHAIFYDKTGSQMLTNLNQAVRKFADIIHEVENGQGIAHDLIFTANNSQFLRSLNNAAADIELITGDIKNGKGSLGLLVKDPGIYNELYGLVGSLRRNRLVKAVFRMVGEGQSIPSAP